MAVLCWEREVEAAYAHAGRRMRLQLGARSVARWVEFVQQRQLARRVLTRAWGRGSNKLGFAGLLR